MPADPERPTGEPVRTGVVRARRTPDGQRILILPDGGTARIDPGMTPDEIADRYRLDRVVVAPAVEWCTAVHLDGPLEGRHTYAVNRLGYRGESGYEVTRLADGDRPAGLTFDGG
jgi:hypothetical protein